MHGLNDFWAYPYQTCWAFAKRQGRNHVLNGCNGKDHCGPRVWKPKSPVRISGGVPIELKLGSWWSKDDVKVGKKS